jgi:sulfate/thiosulfate-binding protein
MTLARHFSQRTRLWLGPVIVTLTLAACRAGTSSTDSSGSDNGTPRTTDKITLGGYTTPREAYGEILPVFAAQWQKDKGRSVSFQESYLASGAQARAIVGGFEADVAALSLEPDIDNIRKAGLITKEWKTGAHAGMVSHSLVVIGVREGNPKNIRDWDDLAKPGVEVLTPNVRTSGGARWNIAAIWGAALRGHTSAKAGDPEAAKALLAGILKNVKNMDAGARESLLHFERGVGDAIITYENEILVGRQKGQKYEYLIPKSTILIENPVAVVDGYADKHGVSEAAAAFVSFLATAPAQRIYAKHGLRPVLPEVANEVAAQYPAPADLFTIRDLGDWKGLQTTLFAPQAAYDAALALSTGVRP